MDIKLEAKVTSSAVLQSTIVDDVISISSTEEPVPPPSKKSKRLPPKKPRKSYKHLHNIDISKVVVKKDELKLKISDYFPVKSVVINENEPGTSESNGPGTKLPAPEPVYYYEKKKRGDTTKIKHPCPAYKIIRGTTFAVDSFRFGIIDGITHYFLTHFHADHYIGLTKSFNKPLYVSQITARLVKAMINVDERYINTIELHEPLMINDVEVTAVDANHCPGAVMFFFKLPNGMTILHTGDFRACPEMESDPIYWNNDVDLIYLDTTYLSSKYVFKSQWESVKEAQEHVYEFRKKFDWHQSLIVCGSYLIGKEKVWLNIAEFFNLKVWVDKNRRKVLECLNNEQILDYLVDGQRDAQIHVLPINKVHYNFLYEYLALFDKFEYILAIVPSGWQKNAKPIVRGRITIVGIEYSEHSSYNELRRFIRYIHPKEVISTVPYGKDLTKTPKIPSDWMEKYSPKSGYQESISNYIKVGHQAVPEDKQESRNKLLNIKLAEDEKKKSLALLKSLIENYDMIAPIIYQTEITGTGETPSESQQNGLENVETEQKSMNLSEKCEDELEMDIKNVCTEQESMNLSEKCEDELEMEHDWATLK